VRHKNSPDSGQTTPLVVGDAPTDPKLLSQVREYRDAVDEFAARYVFAVTWAARAVHDALRFRRAIEVPQSAPTVPRPKPAAEALYSGPRPEAGLEREVGRAICRHSSARELEQDRAELLRLALEVLERLGRTHDHGDKAAALRRFHKLRYPPKRQHQEAARGERGGRHLDALDAMACALEGAPIGKLKFGLSRTRDDLEAAVNGSKVGMPLDVADDPDYHAYRQLNVTAAEALREAKRLAKGDPVLHARFEALSPSGPDL
jgi:hypothetical protein